MSTTEIASLVTYLKRQTAAHHASGGVALAEAELATTPVRVPLEVGGALWSAIVERIAEQSIQLIVDRQAAESLEDSAEGVIHFQPDNDIMQRAHGRVTASDAIAEHRVRLSFQLT